MRCVRFCVFLVCALGFNVKTADAFMEKVGKESIDAAASRLQSMGDHLVQEIFDNGDKLIDEIFNKASNERKSTVAQIGSEFHYATNNLTAQFGSEVRGTISHASTELQNNLAVLLAYTGSIDDITKSAAALEDDFAIDIQSLPFVTKHFGIRRVSGINILQGERSTYPLMITGERFGMPDSREELSVKVFVADTELPAGIQVGTNELEFQIPATLLTRYFKPNEVNLIDLKVFAKRHQKRCLFSCDDEVTGSFKLLLTPERLGVLEIQTRRAKYVWKHWGSVTKELPLQKPTLIDLDPLPVLDGKPRRYKSVEVTCNNIKREAWRLPNGKVLLPQDKLLTEGWSSSSWVGSDRGKDLARFDQEAKDALGFSPGFYARSSCQDNQHCQLTPDDIRKQSTKLSELGYCDAVTVASKNLTPDQEKGSVSIVGTAPYESNFAIKAEVEILEQDGFETKPLIETKPVVAGKYVDVDVSEDTLVSLNFVAFDGIPRDGRLPLAPPRGLKLVQSRAIQKATSFSLQFSRN